VASGGTDSVMLQYEADLFLEGRQKTKGAMFLPEKPESESSGVDITHLLFKDEQGNILKSPVTGEPTRFCVGYKAYKHIENAGLHILIYELAGEGDVILVLSSFNDGQLLKLLPGKHEIQVRMPYLGLRPGIYTITVLIRKDSLHTFDFVESFQFIVEGKEAMGRSLFYQPRMWETVNKRILRMDLGRN
jgi:lipopolysaccharide transport system ATP-binding protein